MRVQILIFFAGLLPFLLAIAAAQVFERRSPVVPSGLRGVCLNTACFVVNNAISALLVPVVFWALTIAASRGGFLPLTSGFIPLASDGWWFLPSLLLYVVAMDFAEFAFHVAQHRVPFLWEMHSLHHSDPEVSAATGGRNYWFENVLKGLILYPASGLVFALNPAILGCYVLVRMLDMFQHMNVRIHYGPLAGWIVSPQYHRLHHSREQRHFDRNFAPYLAVWDRIFGTQYLPGPDEYPPTGLETGEAPASVGEMLLWLARRQRRERSVGVPSAASPAAMGHDMPPG
jgi:sterol desaturase/sphingolipid hydroxylase (fatty acid hydroxylase superfamily)